MKKTNVMTSMGAVQVTRSISTTSSVAFWEKYQFETPGLLDSEGVQFELRKMEGGEKAVEEIGENDSHSASSVETSRIGASEDTFEVSPEIEAAALLALDLGKPFNLQPKLVCCNFHAYQKIMSKANTKSVSFDNGLFVTNQNKTGMLYYIFTKGDGKMQAYLQVVASTPGETAPFTVQRGLDDRYGSFFRNNFDVALLYRVTPTTHDFLPTHEDVLKDFDKSDLDPSWGTVRVCPDRSVLTSAGLPILASSPIDIPDEAGKYLVCVYPLMGLYSLKIKDRASQKISLFFPASDACFSTRDYMLVSRDQSIVVNPKEAKEDSESGGGGVNSKKRKLSNAFPELQTQDSAVLFGNKFSR